MLSSLYILYSVIAFSAFLIALYYNKGFNNIFVWPIVILVFSVLSFASYSITSGVLSITDKSLVYLNLGMAVYSIIIYLWDLFDKFKSGDWGG